VTPDAAAFADALEASAIATVESGLMTADLARIANPTPERTCLSAEFIDAIAPMLASR
jgi:isocitrate dehydrogenase